MSFIYTVGYIFLHGCVRSNAIFKGVGATRGHGSRTGLSRTSSARVAEQTRADGAATAYFALQQMAAMFSVKEHHVK